MMAKTKTKKGPEYITAQLRSLALPIGALTEDPSNARLHNEQNINAIKSSLQKFGQRKPVVLNKRTGIVLAGNGTLTAARSLGWEYLATVIVDDDPATATGFSIADNRTAELATWDDEVLARLLEAVEEEMPAVELGFTDEDLAELLGMDEGPIGEDVEPTEAPADPVSKRGEVYELGPHRLMCGDCRDAEDFAELIGDRKINVAVTSPPYASQRKYDESSGFKPIKPDDYGDWFEPLQALIKGSLADDGSFFLNIKEHCEDGQRSLYVKDLTIRHVREWGWLFVDEFCWTHGGTPVQAHRRFKNGWEPIFQFTRNYEFAFYPKDVRHESHSVPAKYKDAKRGRIDTANSQGFTGDIFANNEKASFGLAFPSNCIKMGKNSESLGHGAAYPVSLPEFFIKAFSDKDDLIVDPFLGSGTTLIAAARQGRRCYGLEISPAYCDVIRKRWGDYARQNDLDPGAGAL